MFNLNDILKFIVYGFDDGSLLKQNLMSPFMFERAILIFKRSTPQKS